ncbi:uncharacterized protein LOC141631693 [Silene latifolia]|uniref:uncharacterized protein LOC141631693 n=1 Tax=Silene latifolia TaxID=37657 RepID=UPI003D7709FE
MKIDESQILKKSNVLVGYSGETKNTLGEIYLPPYVEGVSSCERFGVLDCLSSYNAILGRPWIHNVRAIPSTYHQCVKIPTEWGIATIKGEQKSAQECYTESLKPSKAGSDVPDNIKPELKKRKCAPERNSIINEEVDKLLDVGMIIEVIYPEWLENVVVVQKKNDATAGHELLTFMDVSSGFNQIKMHPADQENTAFITERVNDIQRLTGRVAALNRFISRSSESCRSLYDLLGKNKSFKWLLEHEAAFQDLKTYLTTPPLLAKPNKGEPLTVYLSVTETAVSGVLTKEVQGQQHPVYNAEWQNGQYN